MLSNAYFLAKFCFDTAKNEPAKDFAKFANFYNFANPKPWKGDGGRTIRSMESETGTQIKVGKGEEKVEVLGLLLR